MHTQNTCKHETCAQTKSTAKQHQQQHNLIQMVLKTIKLKKYVSVYLVDLIVICCCIACEWVSEKFSVGRHPTITTTHIQNSHHITYFNKIENKWEKYEKQTRRERERWIEMEKEKEGKNSSKYKF